MKNNLFYNINKKDLTQKINNIKHKIEEID